MGMSIGMIFGNWYGCGYGSTCPESIPLPSLVKMRYVPFIGCVHFIFCESFAVNFRSSLH